VQRSLAKRSRLDPRLRSRSTAVAQEIVASSTVLVSVGHLGSAGVDGGRVPITQHPGHPPLSVHLHLPPPSRGEVRIEDATARGRDDNRLVGGQTIVYLRARRARPDSAHVTSYFATAPPRYRRRAGII